MSKRSCSSLASSSAILLSSSSLAAYSAASRAAYSSASLSASACSSASRRAYSSAAFSDSTRSSSARSASRRASSYCCESSVCLTASCPFDSSSLAFIISELITSSSASFGLSTWSPSDCGICTFFFFASSALITESGPPACLRSRKATSIGSLSSTGYSRSFTLLLDYGPFAGAVPAFGLPPPTFAGVPENTALAAGYFSGAGKSNEISASLPPTLSPRAAGTKTEAFFASASFTTALKPPEAPLARSDAAIGSSS